MNTSSVNSSTNSKSFNPAGIKSQLKQIGDQIESIAKQLKGQGEAQKIDELYELGDKIEHFCDSMDFDSTESSLKDFGSKTDFAGESAAKDKKVIASRESQINPKNESGAV